jgi:hypothetical protein
MEVKWFNTSRKEVPSHGQHVILSMNEEYFIAVYNASKKTFIIKAESYDTFVSDETADISWTDFRL